jgi:hypothetical protein
MARKDVGTSMAAPGAINVSPCRGKNLKDNPPLYLTQTGQKVENTLRDLFKQINQPSLGLIKSLRLSAFPVPH